MMHKSILIALLLLATTQLFANSATLDRIRATVNNDIITQSELDERLTQAQKQLRAVGVALPEQKVLTEQVLNRLVEERLILQQAQAMGMEIDDSALNKALISIAQNNKMDLPTFRKTLENDGYDYIEFRERIRKDMLVNQVQQQRVGYNIMVSDDEINRLMGELEHKDTPNTQYRVGHILIALPSNPSSEQVQAAQVKVKAAIAALKQSKNFSQVALKYSDSSNVLEQADLGWRTSAQLPSMISTIVPKMQVGEISQPLRNNSGFHVIQLLEKRQQALQSAQIGVQREQAREYLYQQKLQEAMQAWITQLRDGAHIDVKA